MPEPPKKSARSLAGIAGIVAIATLISKLFGLLRQTAIAAAFGIGPAFDAYAYAYIIPGFLLVLLGGINGPFHSAIVSVLSKRPKEEAAALVETITTLVGGLLLLLSIGLILFAEPLIGLVAPGFNQIEQGAVVREIAIQQLQIMAPMALLAGLIGIGFGTLNAADQYWLPSISPLFSSTAIIGGIGILTLHLGNQITQPEYFKLGGLVLAAGTLAGASLQWLVQLAAQWRAGMGKLRLRFDFNRPGVKQILKIMAPATLSSGTLQINLYTDLFFASYIPGTAAALNYANLLVQTPLGILSNSILVPLLPVLARLTAPQNRPELKHRIRQGLILTAIVMLPLGALMMTLAFPIVRVVYERFAFDQAASQVVASLLIAYGIGMFFYLGRDVLVRVFYALGDATTPFYISTGNILLNVLLDYVLIQIFGAAGIVLATVGVNMVSMVLLLGCLYFKLDGLPFWEWARPILGLAAGSLIAGLSCWSILQGLQSLWGTEGFFIQLAELSLSGATGLAAFVLVASRLQIPEVDLFVSRIRQRFGR